MTNPCAQMPPSSLLLRPQPQARSRAASPSLRQPTKALATRTERAKQATAAPEVKRLSQQERKDLPLQESWQHAVAQTETSPCKHRSTTMHTCTLGGQTPRQERTSRMMTLTVACAGVRIGCVRNNLHKKAEQKSGVSAARQTRNRKRTNSESALHRRPTRWAMQSPLQQACKAQTHGNRSLTPSWQCAGSSQAALAKQAQATESPANRNSFAKTRNAQHLMRRRGKACNEKHMAARRPKRSRRARARARERHARHARRMASGSAEAGASSAAM